MNRKNSSTEAQTSGEPRLYGTWRAERGWGVGSLSTTATLVVFAALLVPLFAVSAFPTAALPLIGVSLVVVAAVLLRIGGVSATDVLLRRVRFHRARTVGWTEYSGGLLTDHARTADLPGILAPVRRSTSTTGEAAATPSSGTVAPAR